MKEIKIIEYDPAYQQQINLMMEGIQSEFTELITTHHSTRIQEVYRLPGQKYWIALADEKVAGTIGIVIVDNDKAVVKRMMVGRNFRGEKYGTAKLLLQTALEWAMAQGAKESYLGTMKQFEAAQRFYLKSGFIEIGQDELPALYPQNRMDTVFFKQQLYANKKA